MENENAPLPYKKVVNTVAIIAVAIVALTAIVAAEHNMWREFVITTVHIAVTSVALCFLLAPQKR